MPDKTQGELIRELRDMVMSLMERVDNRRRDVNRHEAALNHLTESLTALNNRVSVLETQLTNRITALETQMAELQKKVEESGRRLWSLIPPLAAAVLGGIIAFLLQLLISAWRK